MAEYERALAEHGVTREQVAAFLDANPTLPQPALQGGARLRRQQRGPRRGDRAVHHEDARAALARAHHGFAKGGKAAAQKTPHLVVNFFQTAVKEAPEGRRSA